MDYFLLLLLLCNLIIVILVEFPIFMNSNIKNKILNINKINYIILFVAFFCFIFMSNEKKYIIFLLYFAINLLLLLIKKKCILRNLK